MIVFAAIDLLAGEVVQLVGGRPETMRVRLTDPVAIARRWATAGFQALHVVDLDAARTTGNNGALIEQIIAAVDIPVQVGGGLRDRERIGRLFDLGAARAIIGTRAIEDPSWLSEVAAEYPDQLVVAADVNGGRVLTRGWTRETPLELVPVLETLNELPLAAVLITDVSREGKMTGIDREFFERARWSSRNPIFAAGGIGNLEDLRVLEQAGVAGAVLGMALYTGAIDPVALEGAFE